MSPAAVAWVPVDLPGVSARKTAVKKCIKESAGKLEPYAVRIRKGMCRIRRVRIYETTFGREEGSASCGTESQ